METPPLSRRARAICQRALATLLLLTSPAGAEPASQAPARELNRFDFSRTTQQDLDGFYFQPAGLCEDYPEETTTLEKIRGDMDLLRETGCKLLRVGIGWDGIEENPGEYQWRFWDDLVETAAREGITLLPYIAYTPAWLADDDNQFWRQPPRDLSRYGAFVEKVVRRYGDRIQTWELWNEPDNRDYWRGTPKEFAVMLKAGASAVRRARADAVVVLGGLASEPQNQFVRALFERHDIASSVDVVNFHSYFETWDARPAEHLASRIRGYRRLISIATKGQRTADLWLAEFGYSSGGGRGRQVSDWVKASRSFEHTPEFQAVTLLRHHFLALASGELSLTCWFRIRDLPAQQDVIGDENNRHFGLVTVRGERKPAFHAMKLWNRVIDQPIRRLKVTVEPKATKAQVFAFEKLDGTILLAGWLPVRAAAQSASVRVRLDGRAAPRLHLRPLDQKNTTVPSEGEWLGPIVLERSDIFIAVTDDRSGEAFPLPLDNRATP